ncbi:hypothetical protein LCGC14_2068930, partial [marine sediment metagenome]
TDIESASRQSASPEIDPQKEGHIPIIKYCGGCRDLIPKDGPPRCPSCTTKQNRESDFYSTRERAFYGKKGWKKARLVQLQEEPLCRLCSEQGNVTPAQVVDHIVPIRNGGSPFDKNNLQSLCKPHHNQKTARELNEMKRERSKNAKVH